MSLQTWLTQALGQEKYTMSLLCLKVRRCSKEDRGFLKEHWNQPERTPNGQSCNNLSKKMNNNNITL